MTSNTTPEAGNTTSKDTERASVDAQILRALHAEAEERDRAAEERKKDYPRELQDLMETDKWDEYLWAGTVFGLDEAQVEALCADALIKRKQQPKS